MRTGGVLLIGICSLLGVAVAQDKTRVASPEPTYELYSWHTGEGWAYSVLPTTSRQKTPEEIFNRKKVAIGTDALEKVISRLPARSIIVWFDDLTVNGAKVHGTEQLRRPPSDIIQRVKRHAALDGKTVTAPGPNGE